MHWQYKGIPAYSSLMNALASILILLGSAVVVVAMFRALRLPPLPEPDVRRWIEGSRWKNVELLRAVQKKCET